MDNLASQGGTRPKRRSPLMALIDLFSSVWFGITMMVLIFIYLTVGSAGILYPTSLNIFDSANWRYELLRTWPWIDKTEMEFFGWWPFTLMIAIFVANMVTVTVRRIRFNLLNLGVWTIHTGIVILALGSLYYFGAKLEGDTPVFRRNIVIEVPGAPPQRLVVRQGNATSVMSDRGAYTFRITEMNPAWPLLSGEDAGKTACSVNVAVTSPTESFTRQMLIGYPQYTEDIIPGQGRAIKAIGRKLIDDQLAMRFEYEPQNYFYLMDSAAIYVREVGQREWIERPIHGLPHYSEHISSATEIWQPQGDPLILPSPLNIPASAVASNDPAPELDVLVTGRLRYSTGDEVRAVPGGQHLNPVIGVTVERHGRKNRMELAAFEPRLADATDGSVGFRWAESTEEIDALAQQVGGRVRVTIPDAGVTADFPISDTVATDPDLPFTPIEGTSWSVRVRGAQRNLSLPKGGSVSVAIVEFQSGDRLLTRWVADNPSATRDVNDDHGMMPPDPAIQTTFEPAAEMLIIGGPQPQQLQLVYQDAETRHPLTANGPAVTVGHATVAVTHLIPHASFERRPVVTPKRERDTRAGAFYSRIKVLLTQGTWSREIWLNHHRYPLESAQYAARFRYEPTVVTLPDGRRIEMLFSRKRWPLPAALALEDFELKTHTGGYTGQTTSVKDFVSRLRAYHGGQWSEPFRTSLNKPASDGGMYYFQSEWDPGEMAYTGLGVGNRKGVYIQLLGTCLSVAGMIFVFYIKPIIIRRRRQAVWNEVQEQRSHDGRSTQPAESLGVAAPAGRLAAEVTE